jgi:uncharacterized iron-regulated membrane protein
MKKLLYQIHRWVGVGLALFMALWFASGLTILYAPPTVLGAAERWAGREPLRPEAGWLSLGEAWQRARPGESADRIAQARLVRQADAPQWLVETVDGRLQALSAVDGRLHTTDGAEALLIAEAWVRRSGDDVPTSLRHLDLGAQDSASRNLGPFRPLHRIAVDDGQGRELLVSARTGEVVRDSTRLDRAMYWAGNYLHLLRPLETIGLGAWRRDVLMWLACLAFVGSVTGLVIGWQRWRPGWRGRPTYSQGRHHPYRDAWNTWHFWTGLIGGTAALLWSFSGFFNGNPFQVFGAATPAKAQTARYLGPQVPPEMLAWRPAPPALPGGAADTVELAWHRLGDRATLLAVQRDGRREAVQGSGFDDATLRRAAERFAGPGTPIAAVDLLREHDAYYYARHDRNAAERPLPALRVRLDDSAGTQLYVDPLDGRLVLRQDTRRRVYRWLWSALHHWDVGWLAHRPLWDAWMLTWVVFGLVLATSAVVLGWQRVRRTVAPQRKAGKATAKPAPVRSGVSGVSPSRHRA